MRVLFVVPCSFNPKQTYREYPLGVGILSTLLQRDGHQVRIFDQNVDGPEDANLFHLVADFAPDLVGFSVITSNYPVARPQIRAIKRRFPDVEILAGGIHATLFPDDLLADGADVVVRGEGEPVIVELVRRLAAGRELDNLPALVFRDTAGQIVHASGHAPLAPLTELPFVDRHLYNLPQYTHHSMLASRGCPFHCSFCCNYTGTLRRGVAVRALQDVISEIEYLRDEHGAREIFFADDLFLLTRRDILAYCRACHDRRVGVSWIAQLRADRLDEEVATAMRVAGCQRVYLGVEAGSDAILEQAHKGMTSRDIRRGVQAALHAGLRVKTGWIYGLPGPLEEQYKSIPFMLDLHPHEISIHQLIPFPGTIYYNDPARFGIRLANPKSFESFCYGGLEGNIQFDYLSHTQLIELLEATSRALEAAGYVSSDKAGPAAPYVFTTPLCRQSMNVFRPTDNAVSA